MKTHDLQAPPVGGVGDGFDDHDPGVGWLEALTWIGEGKRWIGALSLAAGVIGLAVGLLSTKVYTARTTLLAPTSQSAGGSAAALAALGSLGGIGGGFGAKSPDELYVALLKSDTVQRALADRFDLKTRYDVQTYEALRKVFPRYVRVGADKKSGLLSVEVDDIDPAFAANLANAHAAEVTKVMGRLAVSEAQLRRVFFEKQLAETKESLIKAEQNLRVVQEKSGVIALDKQAEALILGAGQMRALIAEREVQLKVLRTSATEQNPDVLRLGSELRALRVELARLESRQGGNPGSVVDLPVGRLPEVGIDYVRARRELKLQETLLEAMVRQYETAKLDEAKEGQTLQQVDLAQPPDRKSKPSATLLAIGGALAALLLTTSAFLVRGWRRWSHAHEPQDAAARAALTRAWRWRG